MPSVGRVNVRHATLFFCAEGVNVRTTGAGGKRIMKRSIIMLGFSVCAFAVAGGTAEIAARIKARESARQVGEFTKKVTGNTGQVKFDHRLNNGKFVITNGKKTFVTSWSGCITDKIWVYKEGEGLIGYKEGYKSFPRDPAEFEKIMDFSNRAVAVNKGDVVLFVNPAGDFLAVHLLSVKYVDRGDDEYSVEFEFKIY